jgi:hypothetical protein
MAWGLRRKLNSMTSLPLSSSSSGLTINRKTVDPGFRPVVEFKPPKGFKPFPPTASPSPDISKLLSNLQGKHVWHITAPKFLSLDTIGEISLDKAVRGKPILFNDRKGYGLRTRKSEPEDKPKLLLPNKRGNTYQLGQTEISDTFYLEQVADYSIKEDFEKRSTTPPPRGLEWPGRKIPKGLRMRYGPFGSVDGFPATIGSSSEESDGEHNRSVKPRGSQVEKKSKKRKQAEANGHSKDRTEPPPKKSKKSGKSQKPEKSGKTERLRVDQDEKAPKSKSKSKSKHEPKSAQVDETTLPKKSRKDSDKQQAEPSREKKARKDEKKRKKLKKEGITKA